MKLWLKITLISAAVMLLIVGSCSTLLLLATRDNILSLTIESGRTEQGNLESSFSKMMSLYGNEELGPVEKRSLEKYCFGYFPSKLQF